MKTCLYCLSELDDGAMKCRHCGEWHHARGILTDPLSDLSATSPPLREAEKNIENVRFIWKAVLMVCIVSAIVLFPMRPVELANWATVFICAGLVFAGLVTGALLSSMSHVVELLAVILRNQSQRENHLDNKVKQLQQAFHE